jgi:hypothetical protein
VERETLENKALPSERSAEDCVFFSKGGGGAGFPMVVGSAEVAVGSLGSKISSTYPLSLLFGSVPSRGVDFPAN